MTVNAGDFIVFNCDVEFPEGNPVPYVVQWWKNVSLRNAEPSKHDIFSIEIAYDHTKRLKEL